ncbi:MAG: hypothetical protein WBN96_02075 [Gammaproteobacteria bacterium]
MSLEIMAQALLSYFYVKPRNHGAIKHIAGRYFAMGLFNTLSGSVVRATAMLACGVFGLGVVGPDGAHAAFYNYETGTSGAFAVSCSGPGDGGLANPNFDNRLFFKVGAQCQTMTDPTGPAYQANASSAFTQGSVVTSGQAQSSLGILRASGIMSTDQQNSVLFPAGFGEAGWVDTIIIENPLMTGQVATVNANIHIEGTLDASGPNSFGRLQLFGSTDLGTALQSSYQVQAGSAVESLSVNETLLVSFNFVIGTASEFGIKMSALAMTSSATSFGLNSSDTDFYNTLTWGGIDSITVGGNELTDYSILSESGTDWSVAAVPIPAAGVLFAFGLVSLGFTARRRSR